MKRRVARPSAPQPAVFWRRLKWHGEVIDFVCANVRFHRVEIRQLPVRTVRRVDVGWRLIAVIRSLDHDVWRRPFIHERLYGGCWDFSDIGRPRCTPDTRSAFGRTESDRERRQRVGSRQHIGRSAARSPSLKAAIGSLTLRRSKTLLNALVEYSYAGW